MAFTPIASTAFAQIPGLYFISMKGQVQGKYVSGGMTGEFEEIFENERIVMTDSFADDKGRAISARASTASL